ncbi:MAG: hypothetical protein KME27_10935 [Lyngbya sp. HA4199-MV5]|jgi:hypothetical protein|nr:hypothetical protein [Lyngbya sp. HA4199-MV5]
MRTLLDALYAGIPAADHECLTLLLKHPLIRREAKHHFEAGSRSLRGQREGLRRAIAYLSIQISPLAEQRGRQKGQRPASAPKTKALITRLRSENRWLLSSEFTKEERSLLGSAVYRQLVVKRRHAGSTRLQEYGLPAWVETEGAIGLEVVVAGVESQEVSP